MKLTNEYIFASQEPLRKLIEQKLPVLVSYKLAKLVKKLDEQFSIIEEVRLGLVKKYGEVDGNSQFSVKPESENWPKFLEEYNELMAQETEIVIGKVKLPEKVSSTCDKCNHTIEKVFEIEPQILIALDRFLEV